MVKKGTPIDVSVVAELARLELSEKEKAEFTKQFGEVLEYFNKIDENKNVKLKSIKHNAKDKSVLREDEERKCLARDEALQNAPAVEDGYIKVKAVFTNESE